MNAGWGRRAYTWHEAADVALFKPHPEIEPLDDLAWIGNWGDGERAAELQEYLVQPVKSLKLHANAYGVRYPRQALDDLRDAGINYRGWTPNAEVPRCYARHRVTLHVPRKPYVTALPGIPTIRMFEAMACGIPLVCAPWSDSENLFTAGTDYLAAANGDQMKRLLFDILWDKDLGQELSRSGLQTIAAGHTCAHRALELEAIVAEVSQAASLEARP